MGDSTTTVVMGKGKVLLKLTSGKTLSLNNVLYVPSLRRNLVSGALLDKVGLNLVFEADKIIISRGGVFVGKVYLSGGLFVLNIVQEIVNNASISNSAYIVDSINLWHGRLGHVKIASIKMTRKIELIATIKADDFSKCHICVEAKHAKKPFKFGISRKTE